MHWVWLIIVGLIVGALGRALHPGKDAMGWILTLALGVISLIIAGLIFSSGVLEFIVGIIIAVVLLVIWSRVAPRMA
ncbi:MAG TPA: GlsB/YeaQ/YmgE family stress response membrane protein [Gaiellaceae bacterium]|nr:GlsB/YeaQ/YmgE family stress response membrane protein [Gaiellaceae bacterium]